MLHPLPSSQAILTLESCIGGRPCSAPLRLALTALYTLLGCPEAAFTHCKALEIKNIQAGRERPGSGGKGLPWVTGSQLHA